MASLSLPKSIFSQFFCSVIFYISGHEILPKRGTYTDDLSGWNVPTTTECGEHLLLGGYGVTGLNKPLEKTYHLSISNCDVTVDLIFAKIDSWDSEVKF